MIKLKVPMTKIAPAYYAVLGLTIVFLALYLLEISFPFGMGLVVFLTIATMVLAFIDYMISYGKAKEMLEKQERDKKAST